MLQYEPGQKRSARQCRFLTGSSAWLIALAILAVPLAAWSARPFIAKAAPDFALKSLTGANLRLSEYRGEIVIVNFWSTRCGRCRDQLSKLDALYSEHREKALQLLSVNIDKNQDAVREAVAGLRLHCQSTLRFRRHAIHCLYRSRRHRTLYTRGLSTRR
jgi:thiol-disulfide isomerase/thioredoxin